MLKPLQNPLAPVLLTAVVLLWTFRVALIPIDNFKTFWEHRWKELAPAEYINGDTHRPIYQYARMLIRKTNDLPFDMGFSFYGPTTIVRDAHGLHVLDWGATQDNPAEFETVAAIQGTRQVDEYGLLAGFLVRHRTSLEAQPFFSDRSISITTAELDEAVNNSLSLTAPRVVNGIQTKWVFKPFAAAHDLAYVLVTVAWLYTFVGIRRWTVWKKRRPACPSCGYPTTGLTSPTCPECGYPRTSPSPIPRSKIRKQLRHPTTLTLMTLCLFGWAYACSLETENAKVYQNSRIHTLVHGLFSNFRVTGYSMSPGGNFDDNCVLCYQTPSGLETRSYPRQLPMRDLDGIRPFARLSIRYSDPANMYGLFIPFLEQQETFVNITMLNSKQNTYSDDVILQAARAAHTLPPQTISRWIWLNLAHDAVFVLGLLVWLYALLSIRHWPLWKRLIPALRNRARQRCPACNYNLAGLASPTCPECGNQIRPEPVF